MEDLASLGDGSAAIDAVQCDQSHGGCAEGTLRDGKPRAISIVVTKQANGDWTYSGTGCTVITPGKPVVTAAMARDRVVRLVPSAALGLAPHDSTLINIQTIMWVDAPKTQTLPPLTILGQRVTVTLTLDHVDWNFGDKQSSTTPSPGKPYDKTGDPCHATQCPDYFGHTYRHTGTDTVRATATWHASFQVAGGATAQIPGTVTGPQATTGLTVKQARAVLVPDPNEH